MSEHIDYLLSLYFIYYLCKNFSEIRDDLKIEHSKLITNKNAILKKCVYSF